MSNFVSCPRPTGNVHMETLRDAPLPAVWPGSAGQAPEDAFSSRPEKAFSVFPGTEFISKDRENLTREPIID